MKKFLPMMAGLGLSLVMAFVVFGSFSLSLVENGLPVTATITLQETSSSPILILNPGETATYTITVLSITPTYPPPPADCPPPPGWIPRFVLPGETVKVIAEAYLTNIEELMAGNCLESQIILPGKILYVPNIPLTATSSPTPTNMIQTDGDKDAKRTCVHPSGWVIYIVHSGDNLFRISLWSGTTVAALMNANCLTSDTINPGQQLWVPRLPPTPTPTTYYPLRLTDTPTIELTSTHVIPTATPVPPTNTPVPPTDTPKPPTQPPTNTPNPPTDTPEPPVTVEPTRTKNNPKP